MSESISGQSRTPPEIKWLLNQRAAVAGAVQRSAQRQLSPERKHAKLLNALTSLQKNMAATQAQLQKRQKSLDARRSVQGTGQAPAQCRRAKT